MIREPISTMNNEKTTRLSGAVSEMTDAAGEPGADVIIDLVNQIMVEWVILAEWELALLSTVINFAGVGCIRNVVVLEVNWKRIGSLNIRHVQINKQT